MQLLSLFPECQIMVTTKNEGAIVSSMQIENLLIEQGIKLRGHILPSHQHASQITQVTIGDAVKEVIADGLTTPDKQLALLHRVADCCPIVMVDRHKKALLTLHAGWRGMTLGIVGMGIYHMLAHYRSRIEDLWMWIGPCIQKSSYVLRDMPLQMQLFPWKNHIHVREDGIHVDLVGFVFDEAVRLGINPEHIINDGRDTYLEREIFFSHRRAGDEQNIVEDGRFVVGAWLI